MEIKKTPLGMLEANCYQLINEETKEMVLVDPGDAPVEFLSYLKNYTPVGILLTHGHFDHMLGAKVISEKFNCPIYALDLEKPLLEDAVANLSDPHGVACTLDDVNYLSDGDFFTLADMDFSVIATPGHTVGGCCYYMEAYDVLFSGDTLFRRSIGRSDFPGGNYFTLIRTIKKKLFVLPDETLVLPGHMDETKIGEEKENNPYVL